MKQLFFVLSCLLAFESAYGQITINNTLYTPTQLVNGVLVPAASGTTVSNVTFKGVYNVSSKYQVGYFTTATTTLAQMGFASGVVLSTGNTSDIPIPLANNPRATQTQVNYTSTCSNGEVRQGGTCPTYINDVDVLAGAANYYNASILEFDFVPVSTSVQFRYIFGSEEYEDDVNFINYQCSDYNDKFGFLISGPGIAGGQGYTNNARNIARLANGSEVSINAVNSGKVGSLGGAPSASKCLSANPSWVQNVSTAEFLGTISGTMANGNTVILTASQTGLTPGQTYHIKLIVTDVSDGGYDSVVYLEAGSFTTVSCTNPAAPNLGTITQPTCTIPTGTVALSNLPSTGTWTVTASPGGATITGTGTTGNFSGLSPSTNYTFTVTNEGGCTSVASSSAAISAIPSNPSAPTIGTITQPSCLTPTGSVALSGLPATGSWTITASPGGLTQTGSGTTTTFTGLTSNTTYTFTVTNASGCTSGSSANAVISLYTPTPPVVGAITQPTCTVATGSVALSGLPASGAWTVTSTPGGLTLNSSGTTGNFTGLTAGVTYTFIVTDNSGCLSSASTSAIIDAQPVTPTTPVLGTVTQPTCLTNTGSVVLSGLPASGTWTINPGAISGTGTSTTVSSLTAGGSYSFTVTNSSNCTSAATANVVINAVPSAPTAPVVGTVTQPSCSVPTGSVDLSGLPAGNWTITASPGGLTQSGTGATATFTGLSANTTYTFTVTNTTTLCTSPASGNAVINLYSPTPPVVGTITQPTCSVATGSVALSGLPSSGSWTVTASPGGATLSNSGTTANFTGLGAGTSYTFTVTDNSSCISASSSAALIDAQPVTPSAPGVGTVTQPTCLVPTGSVVLSGLPATGTWTINPGAISGSGTTTTISPLTPSTSYTFTVTNDQNCTSLPSGSVNIAAIPSNPSAPITGTVTEPNCYLADGSVALSGLPSVGTWTITSSPVAQPVTGSGTTANFGELAAGSTYTFTVTDANGCSSNPSASVSVDPLPAPPSSATASVSIQPTCTLQTGTVQVTAPLGANYTYSIDGTNYQASPVFAGLNPGTFSLTVQDVSTGCTSTTISLTVNAVPSGPASPVVNISAQPTCAVPTGTLTITSPLGANYTYSIGGATQSGTSFTGLLPGQTYSVTVTEVSTGCVSSAFDATFNAIPSAELVDAGPDYTINAGETVTLTATGNGTMVWNNGDVTATTVSPTVQTTYTVTLTDANGCTDTDQATVFIALDCGDLFVPTAFSPNGDAVNTSFKVKINPDCVKEMELKVYDRWGEVVFETTDPTASWDGKYKEKELDPAVFVYVLDILLTSDTEMQHLKGNLTLIK
jgi:gliding motility-associated-like protein